MFFASKWQVSSLLHHIQSAHQADGAGLLVQELYASRTETAQGADPDRSHSMPTKRQSVVEVSYPASKALSRAGMLQPLFTQTRLGLR